MPPLEDDSPVAELGRRASARFQWHWETTEIAHQPWPLAVASDPEGMLIEACQRQDAGETGVIDPFWATSWRAAAGLDQFLDRLTLDGQRATLEGQRATLEGQRATLEGQRVLELGCGTGHAGLAAALRGAEVTLTDGVEDPLLLVEMSTWPVRDRCCVKQLRFGLDRLDEPAFPLILGSDVTYLRSLWPELDQCLRDHLADGGEVLLSDPYRIIANEFREWIQRRDWRYVEHRVPLADDPEHPIRVMQLGLET